MSNFEDKKKLLFDCLTSAESCIQGTSLEQKSFSRDEVKPRNNPPAIGRRFQGKESIFKRPEAPIGKCLRPRRVPDYQTNPHKWKKYSLDDADISDKTNASAAFAFLAEMEKRKDSEQETDSREMTIDADDESNSKLIFKRQRTSKDRRNPSFNSSVSLREKVDSHDESAEKSTLKGSKVLMPEYVIGQKVSGKAKRIKMANSAETSKKSETQKRPTLQHLFDEEEENEDST